MIVELTADERDLILRALREMHMTFTSYGKRTDEIDALIAKMINVK